jgi:AAA15 family ATPase/GTPase
MIYGANASGKSNLLDGLRKLRKMVLESPQDKQQLIPQEPFAFDPNTQAQNTHMSLDFVVQHQGKPFRLVYELVFNRKFIQKESLSGYFTARPSLLFKREHQAETNIAELDFGDKIQLPAAQKNILKGNTLLNSTTLAAYQRSNLTEPILQAAMDWFQNYLLPVITPQTDLTAWTGQKMEEEGSYRNFSLDLLKQADFNIENVEVISEEKEVDTELAAKLNPKNPVCLGDVIKLKTIQFTHQIAAQNNATLDFGEQSGGTKRFFGLSGPLYRALSGSNLLCVDELETSLHPELVIYYILAFLQNANHSQFLFTTHLRELLQLDFLRRDAIWFCEKNKEGATELFSAWDLDLHKNVSLYNAYKIGKIGAMPKVGSVLLDTQNKDKNDGESI